MKETPRKRRTRGEGSLYRLPSGTWRGAAIILDPVTRRRVRRYLSAPTSEQLREKLTKLLADADRGATVAGPRLTVGAYLGTWAGNLGSTVRPSTARGYRQHVENYWLPLLCTIPLAKLSPSDVERAMAALSARGLSPVTIGHARATLRRALSRAQRDGLVARNVAALATPPRQPHREIEYLSIDAIRAMIAATVDDEHGPAWAIAVSTGLRLGELLGLEWGDVDLHVGTLNIRRALARNAAGGWSLAEVKTARSRRAIPMPSVARQALERQRAHQEAARAAVGPAWQDRVGLVFTDPLGRPLSPTTLSKEWRATADRLALGVSFRVLRHSAATAWLTAGVPLIVVSEALGHTGVAITAARYAAVAPELRALTAQAMDRVLGAGGQ